MEIFVEYYKNENDNENYERYEKRAKNARAKTNLILRESCSDEELKELISNDKLFQGLPLQELKEIISDIRKKIIIKKIRVEDYLWKLTFKN